MNNYLQYYSSLYQISNDKTDDHFQRKVLEISNFYISSFFSLIMILLCFLRYRQLKFVAKSKKGYETWIASRQACIILIMISIFCQMTVGFLLKSYWIYQVRWYQMLYLVQLLAYFAQMYILQMEYRKKVPYMVYHSLFWILMALDEIVVLAFALWIDNKMQKQYFEYELFANWLFPLISLTIKIILASIGIAKRQDHPEFKNLGFWSNGIPQAYQLDKENQNSDPLKRTLIQQSFNDEENILKVSVKKATKIVKNDEIIFSIKLETQCMGNKYKQEKCKEQFLELEKNLSNFVKTTIEDYEQQDGENTPHFDINQSFEQQWPQIKSVLKKYFNFLLKELHCKEQFLLDFLGIDRQTQSEYLFLRNQLEEQDQDYLVSNKNPYQNKNKKQLSKSEISLQKTDQNNISNNYTTNITNENSHLDEKNSDFSSKSINKASGVDEDVIQNKQKYSSQSEMRSQKPIKNRLLEKSQNQQFSNSQIKVYENKGQSESFLQQLSSSSQIKKKDISETCQDMETRTSNSLFFEVEIPYYISQQDHVAYQIEVREVNKLNHKWNFTKRYHDFEVLNSLLKQQLKIKLPQLPGKKLMIEEAELKERKGLLETYLSILLNDELYLCPILLKFIKCDKAPETILKLAKTQPLFYDYSVQKQGIKQIVDPKLGSYNIYMFKINKNGKQLKLMQKRYREFDLLQESLEIRYKNLKQIHKEEYQDVKLPSLPPKFDLSINSMKTTTKYREEKLEDYLNELFQVKGIENCYVFLQFLDIKQESSKNQTSTESMTSYNMYSDQYDTNTVGVSYFNEESNNQIKPVETDYRQSVDSYKIDRLNMGGNMNFDKGSMHLSGENNENLLENVNFFHFTKNSKNE